MEIYIDADCCCHAVCRQGDTAVLAPEFDGKCRTYIEGYRYVPEGAQWTREDGVVFHGMMMSPWRDAPLLEAAQSAYEDALAAAQLAMQPQIDKLQLALAKLNSASL